VTWFLIVLIHVANCPGKCQDVPGVTIAMPSQEVCMAVKDLNPEEPLTCWGKPNASAPK
jgi:hypothetical protein